MNNDQLWLQFWQEFDALVKKPHPGINLKISPVQAWCLMAQIQLACRHPHNTGACRQLAEQIARQIQAALAVTPAMQTVAERGWDPIYDEPFGGNQ